MMSNQITVGELVVRFLERCGVQMAFGVISIHNMPMLDAIGRRARDSERDEKIKAIRFVPSRGEAGAVNMADSYARVSNRLSVAFTSTGTGVGNAAGAMVEAMSAGSPVVHLTGQVESRYLDWSLSYIHGAPAQLETLRSVSKAAFRICNATQALPVMREAIRIAMTAPRGPVSIEIPIDVQSSLCSVPDDLAALPIQKCMPLEHELDDLAELLRGKRRPLIWLGGGARNASVPATALANMGFGIVTSIQGRGIVPEQHPMSLGAFTLHDAVSELYGHCDAMLVVGSRLRSNETHTYRLPLPQPLLRIDVDPSQNGRSYSSQKFIVGDASLVLEGLVARLNGKFAPDPAFAKAIQSARQSAEHQVRSWLGAYTPLLHALEQSIQPQDNWVRDVTIANSMWGNRLPMLSNAYAGVHAAGGGIGQGLPMALGAALAQPNSRTYCVVGDGGLQVNLGELVTVVQENASVLIIVMNDGGYGIIRNIQDAKYDGRQFFSRIRTPDFASIAAAVGIRHVHIQDADLFFPAILENRNGPCLLEVDMAAIGPFARTYAGSEPKAD